jgi:hypothetical protein
MIKMIRILVCPLGVKSKAPISAMKSQGVVGGGYPGRRLLWGWEPRRREQEVGDPWNGTVMGV